MRIFDRQKSRGNDPFCGIDMGAIARDTLTGFTGVVMARVEYLTGCNQVSLQPVCEKDNELKAATWFDVERVELLDAPKVVVSARPTGADIPPPAAAAGAR